MDRNKVEDILLKIGIQVNAQGLDYIADAMEVFENNGYRISVTKFLYPEIARKNNTTPNRVERSIRSAIKTANSDRGDYEAFEQYIGHMNTTNSAALISLYKHIKREKEEEMDGTANQLSNMSPELNSLIRKIVREEIWRMASS